ncbi:MAG: AzlD domain-containing protein [Magnetovibrio sp.]|nr:AzlD domain-containing protein [Magnetovibrio sp.]
MTEPSLYSPVLMITLAAVATYASRLLGTFLSGKISTDSAVIEWITCVTYALLAGLVVRMIWLPIGALAQTPDWMRLTAAATGLIVFAISRKNIGLAVLLGSLVLVALTSLF